jgi:hypothetical protein
MNTFGCWVTKNKPRDSQFGFRVYSHLIVYSTPFAETGTQPLLCARVRARKSQYISPWPRRPSQDPFLRAPAKSQSLARLLHPTAHTVRTPRETGALQRSLQRAYDARPGGARRPAPARPRRYWSTKSTRSDVAVAESRSTTHRNPSRT